MQVSEPVAIGGVANFVGGSSVKGLAADLRELAAPIARDEKIDVTINDLARLTRLNRWRIFNVWYGKAKHVTPEECAVVAQALADKRRSEKRNEWQELWTRLLRLESQLAQSDPEFHRPSIDAARAMRRA